MNTLKKKKLTQKRLKELLDYNPTTGDWFWKIKSNHFINIGDRAGYTGKNGYRYIGVLGTNYKSARLAYLFIEGYMPEKEVDHEDQNPLNEKWENLRHISHQCNMRNIKIYSHNTSGVTGVCWNTRANKWMAHITISNKLKHGGVFNLFSDAVAARFNLETKYGWSNCNNSSTSYLYLKSKGLL